MSRIKSQRPIFSVKSQHLQGTSHRMVAGVHKEGQGIVWIGVIELGSIHQHLLGLFKGVLEDWTGVPDFWKF